MNVLNVYSKEQIDNMELSTYSKVEIDAKIAELNNKIDNKEVYYNFTSLEDFRDYLRTHNMRTGDNISFIFRRNNHLFTAYVMITDPKISNTVGNDEHYLLGMVGVGNEILVNEGTPSYISGAVRNMTMRVEDATTVFNFSKYSNDQVRLVPITMNNDDEITIYITSKE